VTHERVFLFQKPSGSLTITDRLLGAGRHTVRWHFHLAPGVKAEPIDARAIMLSASGRSWLFQTPSGVAVSLEPADYSPSYGVSELCTALDCEIRTAVDGERTFEFSVEARS
jgi:uncharacterized heparinase superfamily protein